MKPKVVVIGSMNMDLVVQTPRMPDDGETIKGTFFNRFFGGKGANQAVAAARQGAKTILAGRVGDDLFGHDQIKSLSSEGIDTSYIKIDPNHSSGVASIILDEKGSNRIIIVPGANDACQMEDVDQLESVLARADVLVLQLEIPLEVVEYALAKADNLGVPVVLNPAPAATIPDALFPKLALITPNETEAKVLTGITVKDVPTARQAASFLLNKGVGSVIITLGSQGVFGLSKEGEFHIPAYKVVAVDTVAAGDSFTGALAVQLAAKQSLKEAARYANAVAAISVTRHGAQPSIPKREEVEEFMKRHHEK